MGKHRWPITGDARAPDAAGPDTAGAALRAHHAWEDDVPVQAAPDDRLADELFDRPDSTFEDNRSGDDSYRYEGDDDDLAGVGRSTRPPTDPPTLRRRSARGTSTTPAAPPRDEDRPEQPDIRWGVARSAALVFLGVALAVGAALFLVRSSEPSAAAVSVQLEAEPSASGARASQRSAEAAEATGESGVGGGPTAVPGTEETRFPGSGAATAPGASAPLAEADIAVYVTGAVSSPGVVTVPPGTRVVDILEQVGGPLPEADLEGINLAGRPVDGQHLHVLAIGETPRPDADTLVDPDGASGDGSPSSGSTSSESSSGGVIDINTATLAEVESLPRVGPVLGRRIIEWRELNGPFARPADIDAVPGIGPALLEGILPLITTQ